MQKGEIKIPRNQPKQICFAIRASRTDFLSSDRFQNQKFLVATWSNEKVNDFSIWFNQSVSKW